MGSTTKRGRTRNRLAIAEYQPPGGWPQLVAIEYVETMTAGVFAMQLRSPGGSDWDVTMPMTGSGEWNVIFIPGGTEVEAELVYDDGEGAWILTTSIAPDPGTTVYSPPWQNTIRGTNGEWLSPFFFIPLAPP